MEEYPPPRGILPPEHQDGRETGFESLRTRYLGRRVIELGRGGHDDGLVPAAPTPSLMGEGAGAETPVSTPSVGGGETPAAPAKPRCKPVNRAPMTWAAMPCCTIVPGTRWNGKEMMPGITLPMSVQTSVVNSPSK